LTIKYHKTAYSTIVRSILKHKKYFFASTASYLRYNVAVKILEVGFEKVS